MKTVVPTALRSALAPLFLCILLTSQQAFSQETTPRADKHYIGLLATAINHRTIGPAAERAWGSAATLVVGGHITDLFHAELRAGGGYKDAEVPDSDFTLAVDYFASWYIGMHYPLGEYANIYGQFGFSYIHGEATLENPDADRNVFYRNFGEEFPDSGFSTSWLAGLDFEVMEDTFLVFEGGKLFEDTGSEVNSFQFSGGLRYEF